MGDDFPKKTVILNLELKLETQHFPIGWERTLFAEAGSEHLLLVKGADNVGNLD